MVQEPHKDNEQQGATPLIGPTNEGEVIVNGIKCKALIDSGSQVTTITEEFWRRHPELRSQKLQPTAIPIEGAGGQQVPHLGILHIDLTFLEKPYQQVPAFVVSTCDYRATVPLLIGTNVIRAAREHLKFRLGIQYLSTVKQSHPEWYSALVEMERAGADNGTGKVGPVRYTGQRAKVVPAGKEVSVIGRVFGGPRWREYTALVEGLPSQHLPEGLAVTWVLANVRKGYVSVCIMNVSGQPLRIRPQTPIAEVFLVKQVSERWEEGGWERTKLPPKSLNPQAHTLQATPAQDWLHDKPNQDIVSLLDLSDACFETEDQCSQLIEVIKQHSDVFSKHHLDYGHTTVVKHEIPLVDPRPFRLPYRKIPPSQYQAVRKAITEMEEAGVIRPKHLERMQMVFARLKKYGLKLKPQKCHLMRREVRYLGHVVSSEGIKTDPDKISKVAEWKTPKNRRELLQFLGFAGYYRRFIEGYASIAAPLYRLTSASDVAKVLHTCPQLVAISPQGQSQETTGSEVGATTDVLPREPSTNKKMLAAGQFHSAGSDALPSMSKQEIRAAQRADPVIGHVLYYKSQYTKPKRSGRHQGNEHVRLLLKEWKRLVVKDETLYRQVRDKQRGCFHQYACEQASLFSRRSKETQKKHYDLKAKVRQFMTVHDRVLIKVCHTETRQKLGDRWET
ncbi:hypothetical protein MHYP_G00217000 [Metynnis hypsauchen]